VYDSLLQIRLSPESNLTTGGICGHWASWLDAHPPVLFCTSIRIFILQQF